MTWPLSVPAWPRRRFAPAWAQGQTMTFGQAIEYALQDD
jgi:hypothetical protein